MGMTTIAGPGKKSSRRLSKLRWHQRSR